METIIQDDLTLNKIVEIIVKTVSPEKVILFGSRARGDFSETSDYDLLIVKDSTENERALTTRIYNRLFEEHISSEIDLIASSSEKLIQNRNNVGFIYKSVHDEGIILYG